MSEPSATPQDWPPEPPPEFLDPQPVNTFVCTTAGCSMNGYVCTNYNVSFTEVTCGACGNLTEQRPLP
jgi:hypothetical protein